MSPEQPPKPDPLVENLKRYGSAVGALVVLYVLWAATGGYVAIGHTSLCADRAVNLCAVFSGKHPLGMRGY